MQRALSDGHEVIIEGPSDREGTTPFKMHIKPGDNGELCVAGMVVGAGTGMAAGGALAVMLQQLKVISPKSAVVFDAAAALFGGAILSAVGSKYFTVEGGVEGGKFLTKIAPGPAK
jgi:hypothetical protein